MYTHNKIPNAGKIRSEKPSSTAELSTENDHKNLLYKTENPQNEAEMEAVSMLFLLEMKPFLTEAER